MSKDDEKKSGIDAKISPYVLGIDLGTSNSVVSVYKKGKPEVLEISGNHVTPSVVNYRKDGSVIVGMQAKRKMLIEPDNTVVSIKRRLGEENFTVTCHGKKFTPEQVSSQILDFLKTGAQNQEKIQLEGSARYAVICIPANFDNNKREATKKAGELAGLEVLRLLEEPVAAAMAYGVGKNRDQKILVYDLGGGTFDVSILEVKTSADKSSEPKFSVLAKEGIPDLGGDDFDDKIMGILNREFVKQTGIDLMDEKKDQGISKAKIRAAGMVLKEKAEQAKKDLSEMDSTTVDAPNLIKGEDGTLHHLSVEITRPQFEETIIDLVKKTEKAITAALAAAKLNNDDIDRIILVGGSTKVPLVKKVVTEMLGKEPFADIHPDTVVSQGAAILGSTLALPDEEVEGKPDEDSAGAITEDNKTSHYLGIEVKGGRFNVLLEKGVDIPVKQTKNYVNSHDNMTSMRITIFQFPTPAEYVSDEGSICLGEFFLKGITPAKAGEVEVEVTFDINKEGILNVSAECKDGSGIRKDLEINRT
jgi:molecular chaperone DnaK (HSP70)